MTPPAKPAPGCGPQGIHHSNHWHTSRTYPGQPSDPVLLRTGCIPRSTIHTGLPDILSSLQKHKRLPHEVPHITFPESVPILFLASYTHNPDSHNFSHTAPAKHPDTAVCSIFLIHLIQASGICHPEVLFSVRPA